MSPGCPGDPNNPAPRESEMPVWVVEQGAACAEGSWAEPGEALRKFSVHHPQLLQPLLGPSEKQLTRDRCRRQNTPVLLINCWLLNTS